MTDEVEDEEEIESEEVKDDPDRTFFCYATIEELRRIWCLDAAHGNTDLKGDEVIRYAAKLDRYILTGETPSDVKQLRKSREDSST